MKEDLDYWKKRCELAEDYISETPCDPDIYKEQYDAYNRWCEFKKLPIPSVSNSFLCYDELIDEVQGDKPVRCKEQCNDPRCQ